MSKLTAKAFTFVSIACVQLLRSVSDILEDNQLTDSYGRRTTDV